MSVASLLIASRSPASNFDCCPLSIISIPVSLPSGFPGDIIIRLEPIP